MAYDFSQVSDSELETAVQALLNSSAASFATPAAQKQAMLDELARRRAARQQPPNVQNNLEASATPIPVEPVAGARGQAGVAPLAGGRSQAEIDDERQADIDDALGFPTKHRAADAMAVPGGGLGVRNTPEDLAVYGQVVRDAYGRIIDRGVARRQEARAQGYQDPEQVAYNAATGVMPSAAPMGSTVMVDGVEVPIHRGALGTPMYDSQGRPMTTIGAERAAQEAAQEAAWLARFRANQEADRAKYGDWQGRTPEQAADYEARNAAVDRSAATAAEARNRPGLQQMEDETKDRRRLIANRAMLAGGSSGLRGGPGGNMGMFSALAMLQGVDPAQMDAQQQALVEMLPINPGRATVEAQNMANASDVIKRFMTSGAAAMMDPVARAAAAQAADTARRQNNPFGAGQSDIAGGDWRSPQGMAVLDTLAEQHDTGGWGTMSWEDEDALAGTLQKPPYNMSQPEAEAAARTAAEKRRWYLWGARGQNRPAAAAPEGG